MCGNIKCNSVLNDNETNYAPEWVNDYPDKLQPRMQPGVYMILCIVNDYRYYGETSNISSRLTGHRRDLRQKKHASNNLQADFNVFGEENFEFSVLFIGHEWKDRQIRLERESRLILDHPNQCYNTVATMNDRIKELNGFYDKKHSEQTKRLIGALQRGIPKDQLGSPVSIHGTVYSSIAEAARKTKHCRKLIRTRVDSPEYVDWFRLSEKPNDYPNGSRGNAGPETASNQIEKSG